MYSKSTDVHTIPSVRKYVLTRRASSYWSILGNRCPHLLGTLAREDDEYKRCGTANIFLCVEPLVGDVIVAATERRTKIDFAHFIRDLCDGPYRDAEKLVVVMDNLNTHSPASLYEAFPPAEARRIVEKLEIHYTPKHGSWLDIAEIQLSVLARECLHQRIGSRVELKKKLEAWTTRHNSESHAISWRFKTEDARIKLRRLYPTWEEEK